jgi:small conductance mechanosensitive channel
MDKLLSPNTLSNFQAFLLTKGVDWAVNIAAAIAIFVIGKWVGGRIVALVKRAMLKSHMDVTLATFFANILNTLVIAFVAIAAISKLGVETSSLAAIFAAAGLAIGLAWQGSLSNLAAGVMIIVFRPFKVGDFIEAGGISGTVEEVSIFTTIMKTADNKEIYVPNGAITNGNITNYSARPTRRIDVAFSVGYYEDIHLTKRILTEIVAAEERILAEPEPTIVISELKENAVVFAVRPWVKREDYWPVLYALNETVKTRFDAEGIAAPAPASASTPANAAPARVAA